MSAMFSPVRLRRGDASYHGNNGNGWYQRVHYSFGHKSGYCDTSNDRRDELRQYRHGQRSLDRERE